MLKSGFLPIEKHQFGTLCNYDIPMPWRQDRPAKQGLASHSNRIHHRLGGAQARLLQANHLPPISHLRVPQGRKWR